LEELKTRGYIVMPETELTEKKCTPCQGGIPPLQRTEAEAYLSRVPGWELQDHATKLKRTFSFMNFMDALEFARKVGELCEAEGHHPDIALGWGYCRVVFQTHKINGLHENDFIMAAKVNDLADRQEMLKAA
jgi:4a-hydroxytetrahydrobiopterin dehydratase